MKHFYLFLAIHKKFTISKNRNESMFFFGEKSLKTDIFLLFVFWGILLNEVKVGKYPYFGEKNLKICGCNFESYVV